MLPFNRRNYGRLRQLIDAINAALRRYTAPSLGSGRSSVA